MFFSIAHVQSSASLLLCTQQSMIELKKMMTEVREKVALELLLRIAISQKKGVKAETTAKEVMLFNVALKIIIQKTSLFAIRYGKLTTILFHRKCFLCLFMMSTTSKMYT